jgi:hypothetical protein
MKKIVLIFNLIFLCLYSFSQTNLSNYLISHYTFDNASPNPTSVSQSTQTLTLSSNIVTTNDRFNKENKAIYLNGSSYVKLNNKLDVSDYTVSFWFKPTVLDNSQTYRFLFESDFTTPTEKTHPRVCLYLHHSDNYWFINADYGTSGPSFCTTVPGPISANKWYFVVLSVSGMNATVYLNGAGTWTQFGPDNYGNHHNRDINTVMGNTIDNGSIIPNYGFTGGLDELKIFSKSLTTAEVDALYKQEMENNDLNDKSLAHFPFESGSLLNTFNSSSYWTNYGATLTVDRKGNLDNAFSFDGTNDYMMLNNNVNIDYYTYKTINLWFYVNSINCDYPQIFMHDCASLNNGLTGLYINQNSGKLIAQQSDVICESKLPITLNTWHMATIIVSPNPQAYNGGVRPEVSFYLDGAFQSSNIKTLLNSHSVNGDVNPIIGSSRLHTSRFFNGKIDDITFYNRNLNSVEIASLYSGQVPNGTPGTPTTPSGYWLNDKNTPSIFYKDGNVVIGRNLWNSPQVNQSYKLDVFGGLRANSVTVNSTGADFVFANNYKLMSLKELEDFIQKNKHLPNIKPAIEMQQKGVDINELQIGLLQKVEELTLHIIQLNKRIEELEKSVKSK